MCTVTYLPTASGFILSSNRDESPSRSETPMVTESIGDRAVRFPRDAKGGSWIFADDIGRVLIVLNGAFTKHKHHPPYLMSRGLIAKRFFLYDNTTDFIRAQDLNGIEPFTLVINDGQSLFEFRWDGDMKYVDKKDKASPHIWSSSTLYTPEIQSRRADWFYHKLWNNSHYTLALAKDIHRSGNIGDRRQNYIMNRDNLVKTVSISHVEIKDKTAEMHFEPLAEAQ